MRAHIVSVWATVLQERAFWGRLFDRAGMIAAPGERRSQDPRPSSPVPVPGSVFVEITTDEGLVGLGLGGGGWPGAYVLEHLLKPLLLGQDPAETEHLWERMYRATVHYGQAGIVLMAISGVDLALWDLKGKSAGQPVYQLLGGKVRDRVPVYATVRAPRWAAAQGYWGIKLGSPFGPLDGKEGMARNEARIAQIREAVGPDFHIMIDCARTWDVAYTVAMARILEPYGIAFIEEPVMPQDVEGYAEIRRQVNSTQIAGGEHAYTYHAARRLLQADALDIIQPDIRWTGGLTDVLRICELAGKHGVAVMPHRGGMAWALHAIMARPECTLAEGLALTEAEAAASIFEGEPLPQRGALVASDAPGFGLRLRPDILARYIEPQTRGQDGSPVA